MDIMTHFQVKENKAGQLILVNRNVAEDILYIDYNKNISHLKLKISVLLT